MKDSYAAWIERMKIPPVVGRDPLDLDFPSELFPTTQKNRTPNPGTIMLLESYMHQQKSVDPPVTHIPGPFLDPTLLQRVTKEEYERMTLEHFFVFDARLAEEDHQHVPLLETGSQDQ
jgi:hypothetical protein